jgi:LacI family transcriptional regulator
MAELGLSDHARVLRVPPTDMPRDDQLRAYLTGPDRPRAIFCWSDLDAVPVRNMAWQLGIRVPEDLALVGYDNNPVVALPMINVASIDQDGRRMGRVAAEALLTRIGGRSVAEHILIEPTLIARGSL